MIISLRKSIIYLFVKVGQIKMAAKYRVFVKSSPNSFPHSAILLSKFWHQNLFFWFCEFCRTVARLQSQGASKVAILRTTDLENFFSKSCLIAICAYVKTHLAVIVTVYEILQLKISKILIFKWPVTLKSRPRSIKLGQCNTAIPGYNLV
jgi:hypothetical protein